MRRLTVLLLLGLMVVPVGAQPVVKVFDKFWGGSSTDSFSSCALDSSGNTYAAGTATISAFNVRHKVIKYGPNGAIVWSQDLGQTAVAESSLATFGNSLIGVMQPVPGGFGARTFQLHRLNAATGAIDWTLSDEGLHLGDLAVTATRVALIRKIEGEGLRAGGYSLTNGVAEWDVLLGATNSNGQIVSMPDGNFIVVLAPSPGDPQDEFIVRKLAGANGAMLWERKFAHLELGATDVLKPSGNVVVGFRLPPQVEVLDGVTGATLRVDSVLSRVEAVRASLSDSYFAVINNTLTTSVQHRDASGHLLGTADTEGSFRKCIVDSSGSLIGLSAERQDPNIAILDLKFSRELASLTTFFPVDLNLNASAGSLGLASNGTLVASAGTAAFEVSGGLNVQARIVLFKQNLQVNADVFAFRRGKALDIGSPGFLANDAAWVVPGVLVGLQSGTTNGTVSLNANRSFRYVPNTGSQQTDSFTYVVKIGATTKTQSVSLVPLLISGLDVGTGRLEGGESGVGRVLMNQPNPFHNLVVQLSENIDGLVVTSSIKIPQGATAGEFNIITSPVVANQVGTISATLDGLTTTVPFTVKRAVPLKLTLLPERLVGGQAFIGTVTMTGSAPSEGYAVAITHSGTEITTPVSVTVPAGAKTVAFNGSTAVRSTTVTHLLTATSGGVSKTRNLTLDPGGLFSFSITPATVRGGASVNGKVQTAGLAPTGGTVITITKSGESVSVPPTVTVPAGAQFQNFTMTTTAVTTSVTRTITATFGTIVKTQTLTITP